MYSKKCYLWDNQGNSIVGCVLENIKESLLTLLGMIMTLWLHFIMFSLSYLTKLRKIIISPPLHGA